MLKTASPAWLWKNQVFVDVQLQLRTARVANVQADQPDAQTEESPSSGRGRTGCGSRSGRAKAARTGEGSSTAPEAATAAAQDVLHDYTVTFCLHSTIMAGASPYFHKRLTGADSSSSSGAALAYTDASSAASAAGGDMVPAAQRDSLPAARWLLVEHVEEGELDAMEAVLRHCYTGEACEGGDGAAQPSVAMLLQMMVLADRFDVPLCSSHCCEELLGREAAEYDIPAINLISGRASHSRLSGVATERLLQLLGDAEAVCGAWFGGDSSLASQLLQLSLPSLLALLSSKDLKARSENAVLMMADAWTTGPQGAAGTAAQRRQVAEVLRLGQLTHTFTFDVLKALPWLQLTEGEHESLTHFAAAGADRQVWLVKQKQVVGPAAWYAGAERVAWPGPATVELVWDLTEAELAQHLLRLRSRLPLPAMSTKMGPRAFYNGFAIAPSLCIRGGDEPSAVMGHSVHVHRADTAAAGGKGIKCRGVESRVILTVADCGPVKSKLIGPSSFTSVSYKLPLVVGSQVLDVAGWAAYMVDGKMGVKCTLKCCV